MKSFLIAVLAAVNLVLGFALVQALVDEPTAVAQNNLAGRQPAEYLVIPINTGIGSMIAVIDSQKRAMTWAEFKGQSLQWYAPLDLTKAFTQFPP
jgi:hypothetical protein